MGWRIRTGLLAAATAVAACTSGAWAQGRSPDPAITTRPPPAERVAVPRRVPRVTVYPSSRYYRKCVFALAVEHRLSGDVLTPQQRCVWALR